MKKYIFLVVVLIIILAVGYWTGTEKVPVSSKKDGASVETISGASSADRTVLPRGPVPQGSTWQAGSVRGETPSLPQQGAHRQTSGKGGREPRAYNMDDPLERAMHAASLREEGLSEEKIQEILRPNMIDGFPGDEEFPQPYPADAHGARAYHTDDPYEREVFAASLREKGLSEEKIQEILRPSMDEGFPEDEEFPEPFPADAHGARAYHTDDPYEREVFAASLREKGLSEEEIRTVLREPSDAPVHIPVD